MLQTTPAIRRPRQDRFGAKSRVVTRTTREFSVLCVDDHPSFLAAVQRSFEQQGWFVATAIDGGSALARALAQSFNVMLVDLRLPDFSGIELVRRLRHVGITTPAVILTAFPEAKSAVEATKLGLDYLLKTEALGPVLIETKRAAPGG